MRARLRRSIVSLIAVVAVALISHFTPAPGISAADGPCPASTTWDDALNRCV